jgi:hypothetical protein
MSCYKLNLARIGADHYSTLTSGVLDRVLQHADTIVIAGKSFRMKDRIDR